MAWISNNLRVIINHTLVDGRIVIAHLAEPGRPEAWCNHLYKHVFTIACGIARPYHPIGIQRIDNRIRTVRISVPYFMGNPPALQIPHPVIFEGQFHPPFVPYPFHGNRGCGNTVFTKTGTFTEGTKVSRSIGIPAQFKRGFCCVEVNLSQPEPYPPYVASYSPCTGSCPRVDIFP